MSILCMLTYLSGLALTSRTGVLWCTMVYYSVLRCTEVYCGVLRCTVVYYGVLRWTVVYHGVLRCTVVYWGVLWCTEVYCSVPWCTEVHCGVLWCTELYCSVPGCTEVYCGVLWCTVVYHGVLRCTVVYWGVLRCTEVHCGVPWCTVEYYGLLRCTEVYWGVLRCTVVYYGVLRCTVVYRSQYVYPVGGSLHNEQTLSLFLFLSASQHVCPWLPGRCLGCHFGAGSGKDSNTDSCPPAGGKRWTCGTGTLWEDYARCDWQQCPAVPITPPVESGYHPRIPGGGAGRLVEWMSCEGGESRSIRVCCQPWEHKIITITLQGLVPGSYLHSGKGSLTITVSTEIFKVSSGVACEMFGCGSYENFWGCFIPSTWG